jgi:hypothetical protein
MSGTFVPRGFTPPAPPAGDGFILEPLSPEHNERDHAAWMSSIDHIRSTAGFPMPDGWPTPMRLDENLADLRQHAADFAARRGFTYTVLSPTDRDVIGCVYIYPSQDEGYDAWVRSWVRASHAHLDGPLRRTVADWLASEWPFERIDDATRGES